MSLSFALVLSLLLLAAGWSTRPGCVSVPDAVDAAGILDQSAETTTVATEAGGDSTTTVTDPDLARSGFRWIGLVGLGAVAAVAIIVVARTIRNGRKKHCGDVPSWPKS
jgi:hypothetical protein